MLASFFFISGARGERFLATRKCPVGDELQSSNHHFVGQIKRTP